MTKQLLTVLAAILLAGAVTAQDSLKSPEEFGLNHLTEYFGLKPSDLTFRSDYTEPDSLRLKLVANLMQNPLGMTDYVGSLKTAHVLRQPEILSRVLFSDLASEYQTSRGRPYRPTIDEMQNRYNLAYSDLTLNGLLNKIATYLDAIFPGSTEAALKALSSDERRFLTRQLKQIATQREGEENLSVEAVDSVSQVEERYLEEFVSFGHQIDKDPIMAAGIDCLRDILPDLRALQSALAARSTSVGTLMKTTGYLPDNIDADAYLGIQSGWKIGGVGNDYYSGDYHFILDFGGNDVYDLEYDPNNPHGVIIIDFSGDDHYRARSDFALGSGCLSVGLLLDFDGDDRYDARSFGLGSGWFGFGLLYDEAGDDRYDGDTHVEGAGTFGLGLLIDESGRDIYNAAYASQGFGFVQGGGIIYDRSGSDTYYAGGKYKDINRYLDHYLSMSQGFAYGIRPWMSGGIGGIIDLAGNDDYTTDIFGQGSAYWWGLGLIFDSTGVDRYNCFQYGQGVGTHMALGGLIDASGNDFYTGGGVMQGCGHDYSCGLLIDRGGDDTYVGKDKVQGDGSANGIGLMMDLSGSDRYFGGNPDFAQGAGDPRRGFGSIGLFIDLGGTDQYAGNGRDNHYWHATRRWGGGMDIELVPPDSTGEEDK
ncbi:MAG: hypothetical protein J7J98_02370 [candidate division Zixibacteria bacterium]|nr:hypothetical protein [candidate division Zixibacteria bacterium]